MFDKINQKLTQLYCKIATDIYCAKNSEQGDTNFLSIIIILCVVMLMAIAFISLKDNIFQFVNDKFEEFKSKFDF